MYGELGLVLGAQYTWEGVSIFLSQGGEGRVHLPIDKASLVM